MSGRGPAGGAQAGPAGGGLRRNLNLLETAALSVAIMAPTAAMALNGSLGASYAGAAVPLAFIGALITIALVSYAFVEFGRRFSTAGSVYTFTGRAFGAHAGFVTGWALLLTYLAFTIANAAEVGLFFQTAMGLLGVGVSWILPALAVLAVIAFFGYRAARISTRATLIFEGISVVLILVLCAVILNAVGGHALTTRPFRPGHVGFSSIALASVFAFLSFAGFEGAAVLGEESANPRRTIPAAILGSVWLVGIFYVFVIWVQSVGFGTGAAGVHAFASSSAPLVGLAGRYSGNALGVAISFGATISAFASGLGTAIGASRLLYVFSRDGLLPARLARTTGNSRVPASAITVAVLAGAVGAVILWSIGVSASATFGYLGSVGVLSLLLVYFVTQAGAIRLFVATRQWRGLQPAIPVIAMVLLGYTFYSNVIPVPPAPGRWFPYIVLAWVLAGVVIALSRPALMRRIYTELATPETDERVGTPVDGP